jgi:hypothetical protein
LAPEDFTMEITERTERRLGEIADVVIPLRAFSVISVVKLRLSRGTDGTHLRSYR